MQMVLYMHSVVDQFGGQKILAEDSTAGQQSHQLTMSFGGGKTASVPWMMRLLVMVLSLILKSSFERFIDGKREEEEAIMLIGVYVCTCTSHEHAANLWATNTKYGQQTTHSLERNAGFHKRGICAWSVRYVCRPRVRNQAKSISLLASQTVLLQGYPSRIKSGKQK